MKRTLSIDIEDDEDGRMCDGCGRNINQGDEFLTGIKSCCGGCYRSLCMECVDWIRDWRNIQRIKIENEARRKHYEKILR